MTTQSTGYHGAVDYIADADYYRAVELVIANPDPWYTLPVQVRIDVLTRIHEDRQRIYRDAPTSDEGIKASAGVTAALTIAAYEGIDLRE